MFAPKQRKIVGIALIGLGLLLHLIPLFPAGWIVFVGCEMAGVGFLLQGKIAKLTAKTLQRLTAWIKRHERCFIPLMLLGGLSGDVIQYSALDIREKFILQAVYVIVATGGLLLITHPQDFTNRALKTLKAIAPFLHQFAVGGLLSTSLLFYWFSGDVSVTWPILLIVALFMLSNEFLREHFLRPGVQVGVLSFSMFSLLSILFSFVFNSLEPMVFVEAGIASLGFMFIFVLLLARVSNLSARLKPMMVTITAVFALMNISYFLHIIPPIPLSIRAAGIYHNVVRVNNDYVLTGENETWLDKLIPGQTLHVSAADSLYAYTAIFAPAELSTTIVHEWQYYADSKNKWLTEAAISFPMVGGRDEGYRGYTTKSHLIPGTWRVNVETTRGQILGRINFQVVNP